MEKETFRFTLSHLTGFPAVVISVYALFVHSNNFSIVAASIFFALACTTDAFKFKIPNLLNLCLLITGVTLNSVALGTQGFLLSLAGLGLGIGLLLLPYLMGGMGAGDVKALGALGALIGPVALLHVFVYMGFWGGGFALLHYLFSANLKKTLYDGWHSVCASVLTRKATYILPVNPSTKNDVLRFPYSSAIALGYYCYIYWGGVL